MAELKGSSPSPDSLRNILQGVRADTNAAVRGSASPEQRPLNPAGGAPEIAPPGISSNTPAGPEAARRTPPPFLGNPPGFDPEEDARLRAAAGVPRVDHGPSRVERFAEGTVDRARRSGKWLKDTFWSKEQVRTNIALSGALALARAGFVWGTGGFGLGTTVAWGAGAGAIKSGFQEIHQQYNREKNAVQERVDNGTATPEDLARAAELRDRNIANLVGKFRAIDDKGKIAKSMVRGAAYGAAGAFIGFEVNETGLAQFIKDRFGGVIADRIGRTIASAAAGGLGERGWRYRKEGSLTAEKRKLGIAVVAAAALGLGLGEIGGIVAGVVGTQNPTPEIPTRVPTTAPVESPVVPRQTVVPAGSPSPAESPAVPKASPSPDGGPARPAVSPTAESKPAAPPVPKAPPVQSPVPEVSPTPRRLPPKAPIGNLFNSEPQYRLASHMPEATDVISLNSVSLDEVKGWVDIYRMPGDLTNYLKSSADVLGNDNGATMFEQLMANEKIGTLQDLNPGGPDLSLKGKLEGLIGNWMVNNPGDKDVTSFLSGLNKSEFFNLDSAVEDIQNGRFDGSNADHAKIVKMFTEQTPSGKAMLGLSYLEVKSQTEGIADAFSPNPDYFRQDAKVYFPKSINDYSENGWFSKVRKCVNPSGAVI